VSVLHSGFGADGGSTRSQPQVVVQVPVQALSSVVQSHE